MIEPVKLVPLKSITSAMQYDGTPESAEAIVKFALSKNNRPRSVYIDEETQLLRLYSKEDNVAYIFQTGDYAVWHDGKIIRMTVLEVILNFHTIGDQEEKTNA